MNIGGVFKVLGWLAPVLMIVVYISLQIQKEHKAELRKESTQLDMEFAQMQLNEDSQQNFWKKQFSQKKQELETKEELIKKELEKSQEIFDELENELNNMGKKNSLAPNR